MNKQCDSVAVKSRTTIADLSERETEVIVRLKERRSESGNETLMMDV